VVFTPLISLPPHLLRGLSREMKHIIDPKPGLQSPSTQLAKL